MLDNYDQVDYGRVEPFRKKPLLLDVARSQELPLEVDLAGTFLYLDDDTTGKVYIRFNSEDAARIPVSAGFSVSGILYRRIFLDWDAQAGEVINLVYGSGVEFTPTNDIANLGIVSKVNNLGAIDPVDYTNATDWEINAQTTALQTIVSPASNVNGILIKRAITLMQQSRIMFKSTAPATWDDAGAITLSRSVASSANGYAITDGGCENILIPAGMGLYAKASFATDFLCAYCVYEVL